MIWIIILIKLCFCWLWLFGPLFFHEVRQKSDRHNNYLETVWLPKNCYNYSLALPNLSMSTTIIILSDIDLSQNDEFLLKDSNKWRFGGNISWPRDWSYDIVLWNLECRNPDVVEICRHRVCQPTSLKWNNKSLDLKASSVDISSPAITTVLSVSRCSNVRPRVVSWTGWQ